MLAEMDAYKRRNITFECLLNHQLVVSDGVFKRKNLMQK